ncbi:nucleotide-binding domain containing protein [Streptomyces sp. NPDC047002]|uniref:nucleotide-binding domain containing protein n=1 Tax=Streptomyces sp. NPDC047002 TaxID=3155475 RepID=UPI00345428D2
MTGARAWAWVIADDVTGADTAVLTGGATARAVLTVARTTSLRLPGEAEPGAVLSVTDDGTARQIATKSGSFGDARTLVRLALPAAAPPHGGAPAPPRTAPRDTGPAGPGTHATDARGTA